jgi:rod shape determining protein RodA
MRMWSRTDWGLVIAALGLSLVGALLVWSATRHTAGTSYLLKHLVNTGLGVGLFVAVTRVDSRSLRAGAPWLYLLSVGGLVAVLTPLGSTVNGSRSWVQLPGGFSIQPSELAKAAICIGLAMILAERRDRDLGPDRRDLALAAVVALVPVALVMRQPDLGSAVVLAAMGFGVVAVAGAPKRLLTAALALGVTGVVAAFTTPVLSAYQRDRLTAFLDPGADPEGIGYQTRQVRIAVGSGGWSGKGLFHGPQTQGGFIPFQQTGFVFSVAGEELGLPRRRRAAPAAGVPHPADPGHRRPRRRVRAAARRRGRGVVRRPGVRERRDEPRHDAGHRVAAAVPVLRGSSMFVGWLALGVVNNVHLSAARR